jgi:hypothetical protein
LRSGLKLCRRMRRAPTEDEQTKITHVIVETLESYNWRIERGPPSDGASG